MYDFKRTEHKILEYWKTHKTFDKSLENRKSASRQRFVFFEGPPTANGLPGIHHSLARAFKDIVCRFKTMQGFFVLRKAGWDTHGLPVELQVEKELGFKNKKDIEQYGIEEFNKKAKESVWKYKKEWEDMTKKMGFWIDLNDPYITYDNKYIESLWAIIKKIWNKKLLYKAHKVVPLCVRCGTPLSSHEVAQGYKKIKDRSVYIKFKVKGQDYYILAWTTTPWTLPGNVALAVGKNINYVLAEKGGERYILAGDLAEKVLGSGYKIEKEIKGKELVGLEYEPLFDIKELKSTKSYKVYDADFVSTEDGTGVVHTAVMYGEDDYVLGTKIGLPKFHTVDETGKFIHVHPKLNGKYVKTKETEEAILEYLRGNNNLLKEEEYEHDYPFCWRCDTPLLYYAKDSWFIKMSSLRSKLLANNKKINWVPSHMKEGRFGQWLKEVKDWSFSRERYWGTPLPVWQCVTCGSCKVAGSLEDLEKNRFSPKNQYYILRHAHNTHTTYGDEKLIISTKLENDNYELTKKGIIQAEKTAKRLKKEKMSSIYCSPFLRTRQTAEIISRELGVKYHIDSRITELDHGSMCEGKTEYVCIDPNAKKDLDTKYGDGESWRIGRSRMFDFIKEIDRKHKGEKILIISHRSPLWLLESALLDFDDQKTVDNREELYLKEGELREIDFKNYPYNKNGTLDMHRPFIDRIVLKCSNCTSEMMKIPDLVDVWFDSGAMPYAQWHWPFDYAQGKPSKKIFESQFPADYIVEGMDQTRGWFYTLLAVSTLLDKGTPYKNVISLSHVLDEKGQKMSKSRGNVVSPFDVMDKFGADAARWYFYTINSPGDYKLFAEKDVESKLKGFLFTLSNCLRFYELYKSQSDDKRQRADDQDLNLLDKWVLSKLNRLITQTTKNLEEYDITTAARVIEKFVIEDFSNWWLRRSRKRKEAVGMLRFLLFEISKLIAPFTPFIAEEIHLITNDGSFNSVHLQNWPKANKKLVDDNLENEMVRVKDIVAAGLALRKESQVKVRQPLASISIAGAELEKDLEDLIKEELNVKEIKYKSNQKELVIYDFKLDQNLLDEGMANELQRRIQDIRKEKGLNINESAELSWRSEDPDVKRSINKFSQKIEGITSTAIIAGAEFKKADIVEEFDLATGKKIKIEFKKK